MYPRRIVQILIISIMLVALLPVLQASADSTVINIAIHESLTRSADTYVPSQDQTLPGTFTAGTTVSGTGQVILTNMAGITLTNVHVKLNKGNTQSWTFSDSRVQSVDATTGVVDIYIPQFDTATPITISYSVIPNTIQPPVTLSTSYNRNKITDSTTSTTDVTLTATVASGILPSDAVISSPTVTITSATNPVAPFDSMWTLSSTESTVTGSGTSALTWTPTSTLAVGSPLSTIFTATVADVAALGGSSQSIVQQPLATSVITYAISSHVNSIAGVSINTVTGTTAQVQTQVTKQFTNNKWDFTPQVTVGSADITYTLTSVTLWACDSSSIGTALTIAGVTNPSTIAVNQQLNGHNAATATWTGSASNQQLIFPYSGIPAGFVKPSISMTYTTGATGQFPQTISGIGSPAVSGTVTLAKYIFIISGYDVSAVKTVTPVSAGVYDISIVVTNLGNIATPPNVVVYDVLPTSFSISNSQVDTTATTPGGPVSISSTSNGYYWNIGSLSSTAGSNTRTITYRITGPTDGSYQMTDLYVVGVDPAYSLNQQTTPALNTNATVVNSNLESVMAVGALCLVIIGMIGTVRRKF